ncbi:MAG: ABC transporter ATP-binding protein [Planctomycetes bacterium]|nr:ABC transporter ATP-binding protein [Planctomycetota bacterium]
MLKLINVSKSYESAADIREDVLTDINLKVEKGKSLAIIGPSGSGKSTLLNLIGALDRPTAGSVIIDGTDLASQTDTQLAAIRNKRIGFVFQLHHLLPQCSVLENILLPTLADKSSQADDCKQRAMDLLEQVDLKNKMLHRPSQLSGGQRQRVAVVRALINEPDFLLADEPTGSLDKNNSENIAKLLIDINQRQNVTLIVVTHSTQLAEHMDEMLMLINGKLKNITE